MGRVRRTSVVLTTVAVTAIGGGLLVDSLTADPAVAAQLPPFDNCRALQSWVDRAADQEGQLPDGVAVPATSGGPVFAAGAQATAGEAQVPRPAAVPDAAGVPAPGSSSVAPVGSSATGTNVQEAGVDEPDIIKTDGHFIVGVTGERGLWVAEITGHAPHVIGRLRLSGSPTSLLLAGHRALVLVSSGIANPAAEMGGGPAIAIAPGDGTVPAYGGASRMDVVDLSDPHSPHLVAREDVSGSVMTARQVGDVAWVVTASQPRGIVEPGQRSPLLPQRTIRNAAGTVVSSGDALPCTDVRHPITLSGSQVLTVQPVDITAPSPFTHGRSAGVVASGGFVYASVQRLYVATNSWNDTATTKIHAFDISNNTSASYVGSGIVRGQLLSQWSMSEQNGYLRVATTFGDVVPPPGEGAVPNVSVRSQTSVVVLAERGKRLVQVGHVGGLGRGERVWAVRFMGDIAAVVTFRQTDPLYLVDLSKPTAPRVTGALELTGYSSYLHPVGDGLLLGIGRDADSVGHVLNAKATLFDVRDPSHPKRLSNLDLGTGWSDVDSDAHAFTYLPDLHVALLPLAGDGSAATSIKVDGTTLRTAGELTAVDDVQRFIPVGSNVLAMSSSKLIDVDPVALGVLGATALS
jgi:uncharacterized secreted protein with C-terminal beta-propeller domain